MFNKSQRNRLQELSLQVLGSQNAYEKILKDPQFQVVTGIKEVSEPFYYEDVQRKSVKQGKTKYTFQRVKKLYPKDQEAPKRQIPSYREMTFEELESALIAASEMKGFQALLSVDEKVFYETLIGKYLDGTIINRPYLFVAESEKPEFDKSMEYLHEDQKELLKQYVVPNAPKRGTFVVSGIKFVDELIYQNSHHSEPDEVAATPE